MRMIEVSTRVFSAIWAARLENEENENTILERLLLPTKRGKSPSSLSSAAAPVPVAARAGSLPAHAAWWEVVHAALGRIGGEGSLSNIYSEVRRLCEEIGKRMPRTLEETVRGTLEDNSADSERHKFVRDVFSMPRGKNAGYWAIRKS